MINQKKMKQQIDIMVYKVYMLRYWMDLIKIKKFISIIIFQQHIMYVLKMEKHLLLVLIIPNLIILLITAYNYYRTPYIYGFVGLLLIIILMIGKSKGMRTIISLAFTLYAIVDLLLPMIFSGFSPIISTIFIVILTTGYSLFMLNGASIKTWVAVIATSLGVIISGLSF